MKYDFGQNWDRFSKALSKQDYLNARDSLKELTGDLQGKTFLDVGCGSGIFTVAANSLGALKAIGIDADLNCVQVSLNNLNKISQWDDAVGGDNIEFMQRSILNGDDDLGTFDVVYSWGVLHHTGKMFESFGKVAALVGENGLLVISIYNRHFTSVIWKKIKYLYNVSPGILRFILFYVVYILKFIGVALTQLKNPLKKGRGMKFYYDVYDWVGGYPYEYASVDEVISCFKEKGFKLVKVDRTKGFTGCNEFVFRRKS